MPSTLKFRKSERGFSLVELAVVLMVLGVLLVPALHGYQLYLQEKRAEETDRALLQARNAIGDFRSIYGRYPCPSRATAVEGDADYGRESRTGANCDAVAGGVWSTVSNRPADATFTDQDIFIGTLPFRQMNLPHEFVHDGYNNKLTYAVTEMLTRDNEYSNAAGGITIVGLDDLPLLTAPDSGHFVIISHNSNDTGAFSREGAMVGACPVGSLEEENCDRDSTYRAGQTGDNFDDLVFYNVTDGVEQWQLSANDPQDIHLTRSTRFAIGTTDSAPTAGFVEAEVKEIVSGDDTGTVIVASDLAAPGTGKVLSPAICDESGLNCFHPRIIAGDNATDGTIYCGDPGDGGDLLVGIENGTEKCDDEVYFSCPAGQYVSGFDANGNVVCDVEPPIICPVQNLTTTCGDVRSVTPFFNGGQYVGLAYSGQCYEIANLNTTDVDNLLAGYSSSQFTAAMADLRDHLDDNYNDLPRNSTDCGPDENRALIRDTFRCDGGVWDTNPINTIERLYLGTNLASFGPYYSSGSYPAEAPGVAYNAADPMSVDPNNSNNYRDCWCREDYRVVDSACGGGLSGRRFRIERHNCPRSSHGWDRVYPTSGSYNTQFCGCSPGTTYSSQSCASYYGYSGPGIIGTVNITNSVTCPSGPSGSPVTTPTSYDTTNCACPYRADVTTTDSCPFGTTNSFTYNSVNYTGVENIYVNTWSCPGGPAPVQPISSAADAGSWSGATLVHTEACTCDSSLTQTHVEACPAGYQGTGRTYVLPYDCATGTFESPGPSNLQNDDCRQCVWQPGTLRPGIQTSAAAEQVGGACPSCSGNTSCFDALGPSAYKVWDGCYCAGQP